MTDLSKFKGEIIKYTILIAVFAEIISLPLVGFKLAFSSGLVVGTLVTILNFNLLVYAGHKVINEQKVAPMLGGYVARLAIYGASFVACASMGKYAAIGCIAGFVTLHVGILFTYLVVYGLIKKEKNPLNDWTEPKQWNDLSIYDDEDDDWGK